MLQRIRDVVQGWIATIIFGLLIIPFAFWGINYYFDSGVEVAAGRVNDAEVSLRDYQRTVQMIRQRWQSLSGEAPTPEQDALIREQAINGLLDRELLRQLGDELGTRVGDTQVRSAIREVEAFQGVAGFDQVRYETGIAGLGLSPAAFEAQMRDDMRSEQLQSALIDSSFVLDGEVDRLLRLRNQQRDIRYAILSADAAKELAAVTEADAENYHRQHVAEFAEPARVKIAYIELSLERIAGEVTFGEEDLRAWYENNIGNYSTQEQRRLQQVLVTVPDGAAADREAAAAALAEALRDQIAGGRGMAEVATAQAEDREAPVEYSEFGFVGKEVLEPEVEAAVFALALNEISNPVRSKFGFHVLQVTEIRSGSTTSFEEVRGQVEQDYRQAEAEKRFYAVADELANLAFEHPESLEPAAESLKLPVRESDFFSRESPADGILSNPKIIDAAFGESVLLEGNNSELIEIEPNHVIVLRVAEHQPRRELPFAEVRERILTRLRFERARDEIAARGQAIIAELRQGAELQAAAQEHGLDWQEANGVRRDAPQINRAVLRAAFRAGLPAAGQPVFEGVSLGTGDYAVVAVTGVSDADPGAVSDEERAVARNELLQYTALRSWAGFLSAIKSGADVQIFRDNLQ